jgi:hypothetical protein
LFLALATGHLVQYKHPNGAFRLFGSLGAPLSRSKTQAEPYLVGGGSGTPPSRPPSPPQNASAGLRPTFPPALHLRLRTPPPASALPSYPREGTSPVVSLSRPSHSLYFSWQVSQVHPSFGDHFPSSGALRPRRFVPQVPSICCPWPPFVPCSNQVCPVLFGLRVFSLIWVVKYARFFITMVQMIGGMLKFFVCSWNGPCGNNRMVNMHVYSPFCPWGISDWNGCMFVISFIYGNQKS